MGDIARVREVNVDDVRKVVAELAIHANCFIGDDIIHKLEEGREEEESSLAKNVLTQILENARIARECNMPACQDTGMAVVFLEIGQDIHFVGGDLYDAINEGVSEGYIKGYLRKSVVKEPYTDRINTGNNTPTIIHTEIVPGNKVKISIAPKGFGSENMSQLKMFKPADGVDEIIEFVLNVVREAGPNPCPPVVLGIGIGGTMEKASLMAKKALLRRLDEPNPDEEVRRLEERLLKLVNELGIGPQGFGGKTTALGINIEVFPTHIAGLPVAVNVSCHATRHESTVI